MFNNVMWYLNALHLSWLAAGIRFVLWLVLHPFLATGAYGPNDNVPGYEGWQGVRAVGVLAFRRTDGSLQFRW